MPQGSRNIARLIRDLEDQGYEVLTTKSAHYRVKAKDGRACSIPASPGTDRSFKNTIAYLHREVGYVKPELREQESRKRKKAAKTAPA